MLLRQTYSALRQIFPTYLATESKSCHFRSALVYTVIPKCCYCQNTSENQPKAPNNCTYENFLKEEVDFIKRLVSDYGEPFLKVDEMMSRFAKPKGKKKTGSLLLDFHVIGTNVAKPALDIDALKENIDSIKKNAENRKTHLNENIFKNILLLQKKVNALSDEIEGYSTKRKALREERVNPDAQKDDLDKIETSIYFASNISRVLSALRSELVNVLYVNLLKLPNNTHPDTPCGDEGDQGNVLEVIGEKPKFDGEVFDHVVIAERLNLLRQSNIGAVVGQRNYFLTGAGAELEQALLRYALDKLKQKGFVFISTPNMVRDAVFEGAGLVPDKLDEMVYCISSGGDKQFCLAGTAEIGLCAFFANHAIPLKFLPLKVCSLSTCYRKETASNKDPRGLFRVHQFSKVEMFSVTANETGSESEKVHKEFVEIQKEIFQDLGLHFNVVDMPTGDLGLPAYRKIDIEAWFPGRNEYGEISSASNCTDFQSRRLHIMYRHKENYKFAHTVNATACAAARLIVALLENGQQGKIVKLPDCLLPYMNGRTEIRREKLWTMSYIGPQQGRGLNVIPKEKK